jgi:hypothetical protein
MSGRHEFLRHLHCVSRQLVRCRFDAMVLHPAASGVPFTKSKRGHSPNLNTLEHCQVIQLPMQLPMQGKKLNILR